MDLKDEIDGASRTINGSLFHSDGPATEKARRSNVRGRFSESHSRFWLTIEDSFSPESDCKE